MQIWQIDCYRRPLRDSFKRSLWELLICTPDRQLEFSAFCPQSEVTPEWLKAQFLRAAGSETQLPEQIQVFRPQCLSLIEIAGQSWGIVVKPNRRTSALKAWLQERSQQYPQMPEYSGEAYQPTGIDKPPPIPLPDNLWGDRWRFASLPAAQLTELQEKPIPIQAMPADLMPLALGLASTQMIPGVVIDGGRQSMRLARWLAEAQPVCLSAIPGEPDGLILEAGLIDRWVLATFTDPEVSAAARIYESRKQSSQGLHFLLVQPDDSGITFSGFWLLQPDQS